MHSLYDQFFFHLDSRMVSPSSSSSSHLSSGSASVVWYDSWCIGSVQIWRCWSSSWYSGCGVWASRVQGRCLSSRGWWLPNQCICDVLQSWCRALWIWWCPHHGYGFHQCCRPEWVPPHSLCRFCVPYVCAIDRASVHPLLISAFVFRICHPVQGLMVTGIMKSPDVPQM